MAEEKTEAATPKRRQDVRKRGQSSRSTDLTGALVLLAGIYAIKLVAGGVQGQLSAFMQNSFVLAGNSTRTGELPSGMAVLNLFAGVLPPLVGAMALMAITASIAQGGFVFSPNLLLPKFERVNPAKGAKRLFSLQGLVQFAKTMTKFGAVAGIAIVTIKGHDTALAQAGALPLSDSVSLLVSLLWEILFNAVLVMCAIGAVDFLWERRRFMQSIRMTKQEVKDEYRQSEGDPIVRAQLRRRRQEFMAQMMAAVKKADVVVTNPTHYAVALQYDEVEMAAPTVVAKGQDFLAQTLKEVAREAGVPVLENPPLARALYRSVAVGKPIPPDLYIAVAEVLAFIYKLRRKVMPTA